MKSSIDIGSVQKIFETHEVEFAYRFGSFGTEHERRDSDVDIAVFLNPEETPREHFDAKIRLITDLSKYFKKPVDVVVLNDTRSLFFKYILVKEGILIFNHNESLRIDFECQTLSLYFDYQPFLQDYNRAYVERSL